MVTVTSLSRTRPAVAGEARFGDEAAVGATFSAAVVDLIACEPQGGRLGMLRLQPIGRRHDRIALFCADGVPAGSGVWELSRLRVALRLSTVAAVQVRLALALAAVEHALAVGIEHYVMVVPAALVPQVLAVGWTCTPLGLPAEIGGDVALGVAVTSATPDRLRARLAGGPVLRPIVAPSDGVA